MKILGISLSQFHKTAGFQLLQCVPSNTLLTKQQFGLYSDLILKPEELYDRILAIEFKKEYFLIVKPVVSRNKDNQYYKREIYRYALSILVNKSDYLDKVKQPLYKHIMSKVTQFFKIMEEQNHIIYQHENYSPYILKILTKIFQDINQKGRCDLTYLCNHYTFVNTNHPPNTQKHCNITLSSVPVTVLTEKQINKIESQLAKQLLLYAHEGIFCFKKIFRLHPDKKQSQIKSFYQKAVERGLVFILDMVNMNNFYCLTQKILQFLPQHQSEKHKMMTQIVKFIKINPAEQLNNQQILCLYLQFNRVAPLSKIIQTNKRLIAKINIYKFVRMGQIYGIIKRLHQKIAYSELPSTLVQADELKKWLIQNQKGKNCLNDRFFKDQIEKLEEQIKKYLGSNMTVDEMMVNLQVDQQRLLNLLSPQNRFVMQINDHQ